MIFSQILNKLAESEVKSMSNDVERKISILAIVGFFLLLGFSIFIGTQIHSETNKYNNQVPVTVEVENIGTLEKGNYLRRTYTVNLDVLYNNKTYRYEKVLYYEEVPYFLEHTEVGGEIEAYYDPTNDTIMDQLTKEQLNAL